MAYRGYHLHCGLILPMHNDLLGCLKHSFSKHKAHMIHHLGCPSFVHGGASQGMLVLLLMCGPLLLRNSKASAEALVGEDLV